MDTQGKLKVLLAACIGIVGLLASIQYYLVRNTYELTKAQYSRELKTAANRIIDNQSALEKKVLESFIGNISSLANGKMNQQQFLNTAARKTDSVTCTLSRSYNQAFQRDERLKGVSYVSRYEELVIEFKGIRHVLASAQNERFLKGSQAAPKRDNLLQVRTFQGSFDGKSLGIGASNPGLGDVKLWFKGKQYANVSGWNQELVKRMSGVFMLAAGLLLAVSILFYMMFRAILQQKKVAEIQTDFTNNITHELKTPLSSISVILKSFAKREVRSNPELFDELLQSLNRQQHKIQQTVDSVLESAMLTNSHIEKTDVDITAYLMEYAEDLKLAAHRLETVIVANPQFIKTHLPSIEKALNNLIDNAVKYSPEGTVVRLKAYAGGSDYFIEVADQGAGIADSYQNQIFKKFYRIPEQNRHTAKGLGLGLYISRLVIKQVGGSLTLNSSIDKGCTFTIKLPLNES